MIYMISYDLHSPTKNREDVENDIKSFGTWCKYLTTTFLISTSADINTVSKKCVSPQIKKTISERTTPWQANMTGR